MTENDLFESLASYLGICDIIKLTYPTRRFYWFVTLKTTLYGTFLFVLCCRSLTRYTRSVIFAAEALEYMFIFTSNICVCPA